MGKSYYWYWREFVSFCYLFLFLYGINFFIWFKYVLILVLVKRLFKKGGVLNEFCKFFVYINYVMVVLWNWIFLSRYVLMIKIFVLNYYMCNKIVIYIFLGFDFIFFKEVLI